MDPPSPPPPPIPESRPRPLTPPVLLTRPRPPLPYARPLQPPQSLPPRPRPQVFVSFRGKELRHGFVSHVVKALRIAGVNVFIDSNEMKGRDLQNLFKRIENSKMALVIFSDRFSESDWCLNELVKIDDCVKEGKQVIPVFYRVNTDDVKNFKGKFGSCFIETVQRQSPKEEPMAERWVNSVKSISSKTGFTSEVHRIDSYLVDAIVRDVKRQLPYVPTKEKELPIETEIFFALVLAGLCNFIAPLIFNDTSFYKTPQWFVGVLFLVLIRRKFA